MRLPLVALLGLSLLTLSCGPREEAAPPPVPQGLNLTVDGQAKNYAVEGSEVWAVVAENPENPTLLYVVRGPEFSLVMPFPPGTGHSGTELRWKELVGKDLQVVTQAQGSSQVETSTLQPPQLSEAVPIEGGSFHIDAVEGTEAQPVIQGKVRLDLSPGGADGTFRFPAPLATSD